LALLRSEPLGPKMRAEIVSTVWNDVTVTKKTVDVHIFNLRRKIKRLGLDIQHIAPNSFLLQQKG